MKSRKPGPGAILFGAIGGGLIAVLSAVLYTVIFLTFAGAGGNADLGMLLFVVLPALTVAGWHYYKTPGSAGGRIAGATGAFLVIGILTYGTALIYTAPLFWIIWLILGACRGVQEAQERA